MVEHICLYQSLGWEYKSGSVLIYSLINLIINFFLSCCKIHPFGYTNKVNNNNFYTGITKIIYIHIGSTGDMGLSVNTLPDSSNSILQLLYRQAIRHSYHQPDSAHASLCKIFQCIADQISVGY